MKKISRRQAVVALGVLGSGVTAPILLRNRKPKPPLFPTCVLSPQQTEGPFYFRTNLIRRDITEGQPGTFLVLRLRVVEASDCKPVPNALVDIWSCDAMGEYSGFGTSGGISRGRSQQRNEKTFLRGVQITDSEGLVEFRTLYPGWYRGRTPHIHVKVYLEDDTLLTSQIYFPEEVTDRVYQEEIYSTREGRRVRNEQDRIFRRSGGSMVLDVTKTEGEYVGTMTMGIRRNGD